MSQYLKLRRSSVPGRIPTTSSLSLGEIALNTYDGLAFMKKSGSSGEEIVTLGGSSVSASYAATASFVRIAQTASYFSGSISNAISSSYALTASYFSGSISNAVSSSYSSTASYWSGSITNALSSSYALTASYASNFSIPSLQQVTTVGNTTTTNIILTQSRYIQSLAPFGFAINLIGVENNHVFVGHTGQDIPLELYGFGSRIILTDGEVDYNASLNIFSGSLRISGSTTGSSFTGSFTGSFSGTSSWSSNAISSSFASTASYLLGNVTSASFASTASWVKNAITASYFSGSISNAITSSYAITASYLEGFVTSASFAATASYFSGSISNAISASYATTASYWSGSITNAISASQAETASWVKTSQTASYWSGSITNALSASQAETSSWVKNAQTASFVTTAQTASFVTTAQTASYVVLAQTASFVTTAQTASYWSGSISNVLSASFSSTASWIKNAQTASFVTTSQTASYWSGSITSASYALSSSHAETASYWSGSITSASYALSSSHAETASWVNNAQTATALETVRSIFGYNFNGTNSLLGIISSIYGGTGNGFTKFTGPTTTEKTFTLPNSNGSLVLGTGSLNRIAYWNATNNITHSNNLIYDGNDIYLTGSLIISGSVTGSFSGSLNGSASYALTSSYPLKGIITASVVNTTITFNRGDGTSFDVTVSQSGSVATASYALFAETASYWSGSITNVLSASYASTASYAPLSLQQVTDIGNTTTNHVLIGNNFTTGSIYNLDIKATGSHLMNIESLDDEAIMRIKGSTVVGIDLRDDITVASAFVGWDGNNFYIQSLSSSIIYNAISHSFNGFITGSTARFVNLTGSLLGTASYWSGSILNVLSSSYANTASYWSGSITNALSASFASTASWINNAQTASFVTTAQTASFWSGSITNVLSASYALTASYWSGSIINVLSSSYAVTASYIILAQTASYWSGSIINVESASFASTASYVILAQTASYWSGSINNSLTSSYAITASSSDDLYIRNTLQISQSVWRNNNTSSALSSSFTISSINTGSFTSAFYNYTLFSGSNARAGQLMAVWNSSSIQFTDNSTLDIGNTSLVILTASLSNTSVVLSTVLPSLNWTIKTTVNLL